jgi:hypothetical protein
MNEMPKEILSKVEKRNLTFQAILKGVPYIGESISHLIYGRLDELRWKRIEKTLNEVAEEIKKCGVSPEINERFVNILEQSLPLIAKETIERKRLAYVSFLVNSANVKSDEKEEEAKFISEILNELPSVALTILAGANRAKGSFSIVSHPKPQIFAGKFNESNIEDQGVFYELNYQWPIVEEWARRLKERRCITYGSHGRYGYHGGAIMPLGKLINDWCIDQNME